MNIFLLLFAAQFTLTSPAVNGVLPTEFTCDGASAQPPLSWSGAPEGTKFYAVTMHHIPGPGDKHVYLVVYNIPAKVTALPRNAPHTLGSWGVNTVNRRQEYTPPCSQGPGPKTYTLTVYALSAPADLTGPITLDQLESAMEDKTLAKASADVTYSRQGGGGQRPQGGRLPPELDRAISDLTLTPDQKQAVQSAIQQYSEKQRQLREDLLKQLKLTLTPDQYEKVEAAFRQPPPRRQ
jgi:Raf kinase inhibitor-like YbhB/YbcL family protein